MDHNIDKSLVGRPAVYKASCNFTGFEKGKEYRCIVLFGGIITDEDGRLTPILVAEFQNRQVHALYAEHFKFVDEPDMWLRMGN